MHESSSQSWIRHIPCVVSHFTLQVVVGAAVRRMVAPRNESWHAREWVKSRIITSHVTKFFTSRCRRWLEQRRGAWSHRACEWWRGSSFKIGLLFKRAHTRQSSFLERALHVTIFCEYRSSTLEGPVGFICTYDSFLCVIWLIPMCDTTHSYVWHDSFAGASVWRGRRRMVSWHCKTLGILFTWLSFKCQDRTRPYLLPT